jgi:hypothetical protein
MIGVVESKCWWKDRLFGFGDSVKRTKRLGWMRIDLDPPASEVIVEKRVGSVSMNKQMMYLADYANGQRAVDRTTYPQVRHCRQDGFIKSSSLSSIDPSLCETLYSGPLTHSHSHSLSLGACRRRPVSSRSTPTGRSSTYRLFAPLSFWRLCFHPEHFLILQYDFNTTCWRDIVP